jgi:hypothetical protein
LGAGIILRHCGSDALKVGTGVDCGALALGMDVQNIYAQKPLSVGLGVLRFGGRYDATLGLDVLFGPILDEVGDRLASVETRKQCRARSWSGFHARLNNTAMNLGAAK